MAHRWGFPQVINNKAYQTAEHPRPILHEEPPHSKSLPNGVNSVLRPQPDHHQYSVLKNLDGKTWRHHTRFLAFHNAELLRWLDRQWISLAQHNWSRLCPEHGRKCGCCVSGICQNLRQGWSWHSTPQNQVSGNPKKTGVVATPFPQGTDFISHGGWIQIRHSLWSTTWFSLGSLHFLIHMRDMAR